MTMKTGPFLVGLAALVATAGDAAQTGDALLRAARAGDLAGVRRALREGADVDAPGPSGRTALVAATTSGDAAVVEALLAAGAWPDARDRGDATPLDVAQRDGRADLVDLLRRHGARGSGKSVGDLVCVRPWKGEGFCGRVRTIDHPRYFLEVTRLEGCDQGCAADPQCSEGRAVGGRGDGAVAVRTSLWVSSSCLTHTALE
jgi:hypothetical protein